MWQVVLRFDGSLYLHDPRLQLAENTLSRPATGLANMGTCPVVPKTFLNAASCVVAQSSCSTNRYTSVPITLNSTTLRSFYEAGGRYVYHADGLRLEPPYALSPCSQARSRWLILRGGCTETVLDVPTKGALAAAIRMANDPNPHVTDIARPPGECAPSPSTVGAKVVVDGVCYQHVHPHLHDVYDFTYWVDNHPGNAPGFNPISRFAQRGGVMLTFPQSHLMQRWEANRPNLAFFGRLGDTIDFASLPTSSQSVGMARAMGALQEGTTVESCGSPGEVSNQPALGHRYRLFFTNSDDGAAELFRPYGRLSAG